MNEVLSDLQGMKVIQYARVSTDDKGQLIETQKVAMDNWCKARGVQVVGYYHEDFTGTTLNRPELKKAMTECMFGGADILLAYDQSRITRNNDLDTVMTKISPARLMFVTMGDMDPNSMGGELVNGMMGIIDKHENKVRRDKTKMGLATRRDVMHKHIGRPAVFMFAEDIDEANKGRCVQEHTNEKGELVPGTKIITEEQFYSYARAGYSLCWVATNVLGVSKSTLLAEVKPREAEPSYRLRDYAKNYTNPKPEDYIAFYRFKGKKDRYTPFMTLYEQAIKEIIEGRKGSSSESVEKTVEIRSEREGYA